MIADTLRRLRQRRGLSVKDLAERSGLTAACINHIERGVRLDPRISTVEYLAYGLGVQPSALLDWEETR